MKPAHPDNLKFGTALTCVLSSAPAKFKVSLMFESLMRQVKVRHRHTRKDLLIYPRDRA